MARLYGVSYPTVRNRLDDMIARLGAIIESQDKDTPDDAVASDTDAGGDEADVGSMPNGGPEMPSPHLRRMTLATLLAMAITGFAACGDDGGGPVARTTPTTPVVDTRSDESAARQSVDAWLALLDAGNYAEAYEATGSSFRERVTAEQFRSQFEEVRTALGALESRALSSTQRLATLPDAPPGDYFVFEFDAAFELRPDTGERVTAVSEAEEWPVVGYYIVR